MACDPLRSLSSGGDALTDPARERAEKRLADDVLATIRYAAKKSADGESLLLDVTALHRVTKECARIASEFADNLASYVICGECNPMMEELPGAAWNYAVEETWGDD